MHGSIPGCGDAPFCRYSLGVTPTSSVKRVLNVPSELPPTAKHASVTVWSPLRSSTMARSIRRVMRYEYGDSP